MFNICCRKKQYPRKIFDKYFDMLLLLQFKFHLFLFCETRAGLGPKLSQKKLYQQYKLHK